MSKNSKINSGANNRDINSTSLDSEIEENDVSVNSTDVYTRGTNASLYKIVGVEGPPGPPGPVSEEITLHDIGANVNSQFNELRTAQRTPIVELKSVYGLSALRDIVATTGSGSVSNTTVEYQIRTETGTTDSALLQSVERGRYMPGYAGQAGMGIRIPLEPEQNQVFRWGMFDDENGAFFGQSVADGVFICIRRSGVDTIIQQNNWNIDRLDGSGESGITLDLAQGNIFLITFTWYGYGVIQFDIVVQNPINSAQKIVTVHRFKPSNQTSLTDPNLPLRAQIVNNGSTSEARNIFVGGREYSIIGEYNPVFRITSDRRNVSVGTSGVPVLSFRRKSEFPNTSNRPNSVSVKLEGLDIVTGSDVFYQVIVGGTLNGSFDNFPTSNTSIPDDETALLVNNTATTISGGQVVYQGVAAGERGTHRNLATATLLSFELPGHDSVSLVIGTFSSTTEVTVVFRVTEEW